MFDQGEWQPAGTLHLVLPSYQNFLSGPHKHLFLTRNATILKNGDSWLALNHRLCWTTCIFFAWQKRSGLRWQPGVGRKAFLYKMCFSSSPNLYYSITHLKLKVCVCMCLYSKKEYFIFGEEDQFIESQTKGSS